jgi:hypothetical protein
MSHAADPITVEAVGGAYEGGGTRLVKPIFFGNEIVAPDGEHRTPRRFRPQR